MKSRFRNHDWMCAEFSKVLERDRSPVATNLATDATTLATWTEAAIARAPVLFVGAGWTLNNATRDHSLGRKDHARAAARTWSELSNKLRENLKPDVPEGENVDPLWLAELYRQRHGAEGLHRVVEWAVPQSLKPGELHRILFRVPWHSILTTNYDTLLERAFEPFGAVRSCVEDSDLVLSECSDALEVIHLHGIISRPETIVLAYEDYRQYPKNHPGFLSKVRQLFLQHPVMFIGFSATDPNFLQWSGWLNDVVGEFKNPWISLTNAPPRGNALGRYWGSRLQFVTLPDPGAKAFDAAVKAVFETIHVALDDDTFEQPVVASQFLACSTSDAVFKSAQALIAVGEERGYEGTDWKRDKNTILQQAASRLLDLKSFPWREGTLGAGGTSTNDPVPGETARARQDLLEEWRRAIGVEDWTRLLDLVRQHNESEHWSFDRVHLETHEQNWWNGVWIELRPGGTEPLEPSDPTACEYLSGQGDKSCLAMSPNDHRRLAFLAFEAGDWERAARLYAEAARLSREYDEPLRVRLLTLSSVNACLHGGGLFSTSGESGSLGELLRATTATVRELRKQLRDLPPEEQLVQLQVWESEAHEKAVKALFEGTLQPMRLLPTYFGEPVVTGSDWFEFLASNWFAQGVMYTAAKTLGLNQWLTGFRQEGLRTLLRYASSLPKDLLESHAQRLNANLEELTPLLSEVLTPKGTFGTRLSRVQAVSGLVPWLDAEHLDTMRKEVASLREQLVSSGGKLTRGTTRITAWQTQAVLDEIEQACWEWLPTQEAFDALSSWMKLRIDGGILADPLGRGFSIISDFHWRGLRKIDNGVERASALIRLVAEKAAATLPDERRSETLRRAAWLLVQLWSDELVDIVQGSDIAPVFKELVDRLPPPEKMVISAHVARLQRNPSLIRESIELALADETNPQRPKEFTALRVLGVLAEHCHDVAPAVAGLVARLLECHFAAPCLHMICSIMPPEGKAETTDPRMPRIAAGVYEDDLRLL